MGAATPEQLARQIARGRIEVDDITNNHTLAVAFFNDLAAAIPDPADQRGWAIMTISGLSDEGKAFFRVLGEVGKIVNHPTLGRLVMPPRE